MTERPAGMTSRPAGMTERPRRARSGPDRVVVGLGSLTAFLLVLAVLAGQLRSAPARPAAAKHVLVIRKIYRTTVVNDSGPAPSGGNSVTQSVSTSGATSGPAAPTTRTS